MIKVAFLGVVLCGSLWAQRTREVLHKGDVSVEVIAEGRGPLVVLLASLGRDSEEFDPIAAKIAAAGFRVLRPQPRGYGQSKGPLKGLTLHDFARDVAMAIEHENAGPAILAGHAFGHFVAKMTAVDYPKLSRGIVLIAASQKVADPEVRRLTSIATDPTQPETDRLLALQRVFFAPGHDARVWLQGFHAVVQQAEAGARDATPQAEYWAGGTIPILDIQAENDPYRPPSSRNELVQEFGAARMSTVLIPHAAHAVVMEEPGLVADAIVQWARKLKGSSK